MASPAISALHVYDFFWVCSMDDMDLCHGQNSYATCSRVSEVNYSMANLEILVTDLKRSTEELHLAPFFPRSAVISFPTAADGTRLGYARVLFQNLDDKLRALTRNRLLMENKRPLVMSVVHNGVVTPLYVLVRNLAPHVRQNHANQYFGQATAQGVFSIVPMFENQNINRGFCFVFPKSLQDLNSCLNLNGAIFAGRAISVIPGLFAGGRGHAVAA